MQTLGKCYNTQHMLLIIVAIVISLAAWSLHLMQQAIEQREFSLMLAGTLVAFSAAAMMGVYFLTSSCLAYFSDATHTSISPLSSETAIWFFPSEIGTDFNP